MAHYSLAFHISGVNFISCGLYTDADMDRVVKYMSEKGITLYKYRERLDYLEQAKYEHVELFFRNLAEILKQRQKEGYAQLIAFCEGIRLGVAAVGLHHLSIIGMAASAWENAKANRPIDHTPPLQTLPKVEGERDFGLLEIT